VGSSESLAQTYLSLVDRLKRAISGIVPPKEVEDIVHGPRSLAPCSKPDFF